MSSLPERIIEHAEALPEATPICPRALLYLGKRVAAHQALSRLAQSGRLMRIYQGVTEGPGPRARQRAHHGPRSEAGEAGVPLLVELG